MSEKIDIVKGLKISADDYISKPFNEEELTARIELGYGEEIRQGKSLFVVPFRIENPTNSGSMKRKFH